jgi:citrate synthase
VIGGRSSVWRCSATQPVAGHPAGCGQHAARLECARCATSARTTRSVGQPYLYRDNALGYVENFLRMTFGVPTQEYQADPVVAKALDMLFILHADHEQNCSTSTVRLVGSSQANLFASVSAGVSALFGPLHGGANQAVLEMLQRINQAGGSRRLDAAGQGRRARREAQGFGHRVYKNDDPRASGWARPTRCWTSLCGSRRSREAGW